MGFLTQEDQHLFWGMASGEPSVPHIKKVQGNAHGFLCISQSVHGKSSMKCTQAYFSIH
jgi:hypothetical protein